MSRLKERGLRRQNAETSDVLADFVMLDTYDVLQKKDFVMLNTSDTLLEPEGAQTCGSTNNRHYLYARAFLYYNTKSHV